MSTNLRSRIHENFNEETLQALMDIAVSRSIPRISTRLEMIEKILNESGVEWVEIGPGTNRFAVLIDGYAFKIAMTTTGIEANWSSFAVSYELQPFFTKAYECNGVICVEEYVTVMNKDSFYKNEEPIRNIVSYISTEFLVGDMGTTVKNFMNWGFRDNGDVVCLDYGYIYRIKSSDMLCLCETSEDVYCEGLLDYDKNYQHLICPKCGKKYTFLEVAKRLPKDALDKEIESIKKDTTCITSSDFKGFIDNDDENPEDNKITYEELNINDRRRHEMIKNLESLSDESEDLTLDDIIKRSRYLEERGLEFSFNNLVMERILDEEEREDYGGNRDDIDYDDYNDDRYFNYIDKFSEDDPNVFNKLMMYKAEQDYLKGKVDDSTGNDDISDEDDLYNQFVQKDPEVTPIKLDDTSLGHTGVQDVVIREEIADEESTRHMDTAEDYPKEKCKSSCEVEDIIVVECRDNDVINTDEEVISSNISESADSSIVNQHSPSTDSKMVIDISLPSGREDVDDKEISSNNNPHKILSGVKSGSIKQEVNDTPEAREAEVKVVHAPEPVAKHEKDPEPSGRSTISPQDNESNDDGVRIVFTTPDTNTSGNDLVKELVDELKSGLSEDTYDDSYDDLYDQNQKESKMKHKRELT